MPRFALALLVLAACSSGAKRVGSQPSWRGGTSKPTAPVMFAPTSQPATRYNEPPQAPPSSPLTDAVVDAVRDAAVMAKVVMPVADARLFRACDEIAAAVPEGAVPPNSVVAFALQRQGLIEPTPHLIVVSNAVPAGLAEQLKLELPAVLANYPAARVGVGSAKRKPDGTATIVFALLQIGVSTAPIPRSVPAGGSFPIDAVIDERFREPDLLVTRENGVTEQIAIALGKFGAFKASVACGKHKGRQQVEISASGTAGSTVLANFPVWCDEQPPLALNVESTDDDGTIVAADEAEKRLLALINRDRQTAGLPALLWDDRVTAVSRAHSEDMRKAKFVAHISPTTGAATDRVRAAGIKTTLVLENVARAYSVGEAHNGLMGSPGHRANVLASTATHVGIGVVFGDAVSGREMFVTQVFIRIPPKVVPAQAAEVVRQRIDHVRPVVIASQLQPIAQDLAEGLAAGKSRDSLWPGVRKKLDAINSAYARVGSVISVTADLDTIDGKELVGDNKPDDIGVGIAQGLHPEIGEGAIWIVILMAERQPGKQPR